jgi:hypothetical protein
MNEKERSWSLVVQYKEWVPLALVLSWLKKDLSLSRDRKERVGKAS